MEKKSFTKVTIPTYEVGKAETLPLFFEKRQYQGASGKIYPIPFTSKIGNDKVDKEYKAGILENKYIKVVVKSYHENSKKSIGTNEEKRH